jgi:hypothetical protein
MAFKPNVIVENLTPSMVACYLGDGSVKDGSDQKVADWIEDYATHLNAEEGTRLSGCRIEETPQ